MYICFDAETFIFLKTTDPVCELGALYLLLPSTGTCCRLGDDMIETQENRDDISQTSFYFHFVYWAEGSMCR